MDLLRTLLVYMILTLSAATDAAPAVTPIPPDALATPTATVQLQTQTPTPSMVPTVSPSPTPAFTTLYVGDRGEDVRKMQVRLAELGYLNDTIDGIFGQKTKKAVERFQSYNNLKVDGIAGKDTLTLLYYSTSVVTAPPEITKGPTATPTVSPKGVQVPVYYIDNNNTLIGRENRLLYAGTTIYPNSQYVPSGYTLTSSASVTVSVSNGVASPAAVTFRYQAPKVTPTPLPQTASITVKYVLDTGIELHSTIVKLPYGRTTAVAPVSGIVPSTYTLISASSVNVTVSNQGVVSQNTVTFTYRNTSSQTVEVPIYYLTEKDGFLHRDSITVKYGTSTPVYANSGLVPTGYTLISSSPVNVSVNSAGVSSPASVTFFYREPQATTADVTVYYRRKDNGELLKSEVVSMTRSANNTIYSNSGTLDPKYYPLDPTYLSVYVDASGNPTPSQPTFYFDYMQAVSIKYVCDTTGATLKTPSVNLARGKSTSVAVDLSGIGAGYTLVGSTSLTVSVDANGNVSPSQPTFHFTYTAPDPGSVNVPILYYCEATKETLKQTSINITKGKSETVTADLSGIGSAYTLQGNVQMTISVAANGTISPANPTFYFSYTEPVVPQQVTISYLCEARGETLKTATIPINRGASQTVMVDTSNIDMDRYSLIGSNQLTISVAADGTVSPANPAFYFNYIEPTPVTEQVTISYLCEARGETLKTATIPINRGASQTVMADTSNIDMDRYSLIGSNQLTISVAADGTVSPANPAFYFE